MSNLAQLTQKLASVLPENDFLLALPIADEYLNKIAEYTRHIPFSGHADAVWETFWMNANSLEKLGKIYQDPALANKNLPVQQAFLLALLHLLETPKALLNTLPARHRSLYYHELLGFSPKDPQADTVAISFILQKNTPPYRLIGGSLLDAGQDNAGNEITYRTDADILVSNQQLSQLFWTLKDQGGEWQAYTGLDLDKNISLPAEGIRLFAKTPEHESTKLSEQALYLGFNHVLPEETLSVYWSLRAASALDLSWKYYNQQKKWASLDAIIQDNTAGLSVSNLWRVTLPNDIQPGREDKNDDKLYWIKAIPVSTSLGSTENTPKIQCIMANAMTATLNMETVIDDQHFHQRLPAETISQLVIPVAAISHINQPLPSTGGQSRETEKGLLQRAATRIAHRHRALTWNDMRSLLMEQYPQIYDVQFPYVDKLNALPALEEQQLMLIPKNGFNDNDDTLRPEFSTGRLAIMTQWLTQYTSIWSRPKLVNPRYVDVTVRYQAVFATGIRPEYGYRQLALELGQKYMPWGNDNRTAVMPGNRVDYYQLLATLQQSPLVQRIISLVLVRAGKPIQETLIARDAEVLILRSENRP